MTKAAASIRARVRTEMTNEIKEVARRHLAEHGANLSLRAVARELGMVSSALYRYFPSRDDLLTALIIDAYDALGEACERADAGVDRADLAGRWLAVCRAARGWALGSPHEYALIYGSPVPEYRAPETTVVAASRGPATLIGILRDGVASGAVTAPPGEALPPTVRADLAAIGQPPFDEVPPEVLSRGITCWVHLFGTLSFELFGQFNNVINDRDGYFDHEMRRMVALLGLAPRTG